MILNSKLIQYFFTFRVLNLEEKLEQKQLDLQVPNLARNLEKQLVQKLVEKQGKKQELLMLNPVLLRTPRRKWQP